MTKAQDALDKEKENQKKGGPLDRGRPEAGEAGRRKTTTEGMVLVIGSRRNLKWASTDKSLSVRAGRRQ